MKGILFKPELHQAIRDLKKTHTRRLTNLKEINQNPDEWMCVGTDGIYWGFEMFAPDPEEYHINLKPPYSVGEVVYIKEAWATERVLDQLAPSEIEYADDVPIWYKLDEPIKTLLEMGRWRSPLHLRADFARDFIKILSVTPQRLQILTPDDCIAEGTGSRCEFIELWDSINPDYPFSSNPWVWDIGFEYLKERV